ncbi:MAG: hypothetical protein O3C40_37430 [Planctomycetota bacterium]|nr:hypothetical protein [Planctomycetota bacterium]
MSCKLSFDDDLEVLRIADRETDLPGMMGKHERYRPPLCIRLVDRRECLLGVAWSAFTISRDLQGYQHQNKA